MIVAVGWRRDTRGGRACVDWGEGEEWGEEEEWGEGEDWGEVEDRGEWVNGRYDCCMCSPDSEESSKS